jgi:bacillithiol system protein YtxJ
MNWIKVETKENIADLKKISMNEKVLLFKFSPNCSINYIVKMFLEREWSNGEMKMNTYLVDIVSNKDISAEVAKEFGVEHESPQVLIISGGKADYAASHGKIVYSELKKFANCRT